MRIPNTWLPDPVDVEPKLGDTSEGEAFGPKRRRKRTLTVEARKLVRRPDGSTEMSTAQVYVQRDQGEPLGSYVTIWPDKPEKRRARVLGVERYSFRGLMESAVLLLE